MTASLIPISTGHPMVFTKDQATAALRTWPFYLSNTADGSAATGKTISGADFKISKAGGALGNAAGTVTELTGGWYKMVFAAADLDTLGALACDLSVESGVDPLRVTHMVTALDLMTATVNPGANGITAAAIADGAIDLAALASDAVQGLQVPLVSTVVTKSLSADGAVSISMENAIDCTVEVTGTFGSGSAQVRTTEDPTAGSVVWTNQSTALTSDGTKVVAGPHNAIQVNLTGSTDPSLAVKFTIRKPLGL